MAVTEETRRKLSESHSGEKNPKAKLCEEDVRLIRKLVAEGMEPRQVWREHYKDSVSWKSVERVVKGKSWTHVK